MYIFSLCDGDISGHGHMLSSRLGKGIHSINKHIKLYFSFITLLLSLAINVNVSRADNGHGPEETVQRAKDLRAAREHVDVNV